MLNTLSSRATFYDVIGYLVPGVIAIGIGWLCILVVDYDFAVWIAKLMSRHGVYTAFSLIAVGYVAGHLVNSMSSLLLEKIVLKKPFAKAKRWYARVLEKYPEKAKRVEENVSREFSLDVKDLSAFDMRIRMEESMPNATITGFSFLSFYGMSRTMALLLWIAALPVAMLVADKYLGRQAFIVGGTVFSIFFVAGLFFCYQYIRFVEYYYDFLGSTLLRADAQQVRMGINKRDFNK